MPSETVPPTGQLPPVIRAATNIIGLQRPNVAQLEHGQVAVTFTAGAGGIVTLTGPLPELRAMLADTDHQLDRLARSGPEH
ncbi:MAG: hypothetical protein AAGE88_18255 [Actinomycetota bacterium]